MIRFLLLTFVVPLVGSGFQQPAGTAVASAVSACGVSEDPDYAYSPKAPVQVGGGAMYLASRERRFLDALRGPAGGVITYRRLGTREADPPDGRTLLDRYEVNYEGLEKPLVIYLDGYHFDDELKAPRGLVCGAAIQLGDPGPDPFEAMESLVRVAVRDAAAADAPGIPLDPGGTGSAGVAFDRYRLIARTARAAAAAGQPLVVDGGKPPESVRVRTVVIALPRECGGKPASPASIELEARFANGQRVPAKREGDFVSGEALAALVPGYVPPPAALGATFQLESLRPYEAIRIAYGEPCTAAEGSVLLVRSAAARLLVSPSPILPAGPAPGSSVRLQATIDLNGSFRDPVYIGGAKTLFDAASQTVEKTWKAEPTRINGAAISTPVTLLVKFAPGK